MSVRSNVRESAQSASDNRMSGASGGLPLSLEEDVTRTDMNRHDLALNSSLYTSIYCI